MIEVSIKTLTGKSIPILIDETKSVYSLKQRVAELDNDPIDMFYLMYNTMVLPDDIHLDELQMTNGSKIFKLLKLRGD
jgi:uncharacterized protein with von Willebrand factor type A (vWA) domain